VLDSISRCARAGPLGGVFALVVCAVLACDFPVGRLRPWIGGEAMWLGFARVHERGLVQHWGIGLGAGITLDVVRLMERGAIYVGPRVDLDVFPHKLVPRTFSASGSLDLGVRL
jgi:hypothetical protein